MQWPYYAIALPTRRFVAVIWRVFAICQISKSNFTAIYYLYMCTYAQVLLLCLPTIPHSYEYLGLIGMIKLMESSYCK